MMVVITDVIVEGKPNGLELRVELCQNDYETSKVSLDGKELFQLDTDNLKTTCKDILKMIEDFKKEGD